MFENLDFNSFELGSRKENAKMAEEATSPGTQATAEAVVSGGAAQLERNQVGPMPESEHFGKL